MDEMDEMESSMAWMGMDEAWMIMDEWMEGWLTRGDGVFAEKFKLVVCGFELEGRGGI